MKITVIGSGYVGLVTGACLAELGNDVFCLDLDQKKIDQLNQGKSPIYEPGLEDVIRRNQLAGRLTFSTDVQASVLHGDIQFVAVGTPPDEDGSADLKYVLAAAKNIGRYMTNFKVIVNKSTVPVGTAIKVESVISSELSDRRTNLNFSVVSNPEFLKEGDAINDFMKPDRIIIGTSGDSNGLLARDLMRKLYAPFNRNHERTFYMDIKSAELTKYAANAMLATRISFMNEIANLSDLVGADIEMVRQGIGSDSRIGYDFLYAGTGYGGSCFPKDVQALIATGEILNYKLEILKAVESVNNLQKTILFKKISDFFDGDLNGRKLAIWGLSFKPNTDDMRDAPSRALIKKLINGGAVIQAYDPIAGKETKKVFEDDLGVEVLQRDQFSICKSMLEAVVDVDALIIVTEWKEFKSPNFNEIKARMRAPVIFDGRNLYDPSFMGENQFNYVGIGRRTN